MVWWSALGRRAATDYAGMGIGGEVTPSFGILLEVRLRGAVAETQLVEEESVPVCCLVDGLVE